jgi:hypothetical protein
VVGHWSLRHLLWRLDRHSLLKRNEAVSLMPSSCCKQCDQPLVEIDHCGERLTGCLTCNRWQAATGEWCRLAPDDIMALRALKATKTEAESKLVPV